MAPLNELLSKRNKYIWEAKHQEATDRIKEALCSDDEEYGVLRHPDFSLPFTIFTDASDYGVGAVLRQEGRPIWYASRSLNELEVKYDTRDKEAIGIMFELDKFRPYFYSGHVTVMTDHGNLRWLMAHQRKGRLARWQLLLQMYDFTISYIKGENNPVADVLSRDTVSRPEGLQVNTIGGYNLRKRKSKTRQVVINNDMETSADPMQVEARTQVDPPQIKYNWIREQAKDPFLTSRVTKKIKGFEKRVGLVYRCHQDSKRKLWIHKQLVDEVIGKVHGSAVAAHGGRQQTSYHLRDYWFPSFHKRI